MSPELERTRSIKKRLRRLMQDRVFKSLVLATLLILTMGSLRPDKPRGVYPRKYWAMKINWRHCADAVVTGDSRAYMGVSPAEMKKYLPHKRILNYGFAGNGYSPKYLAAAESVLDPESNNKMIIMGLSPHSLTKESVETNRFLELSELPENRIFFNIHLGALMNFLLPMSFRDALHGIFPSLKSSHTYIKYFADGWVAGGREPEKTKQEIQRYARRFDHNPVHTKIIENVLSFVRKWVSEGITVYGFRPPSCQDMMQLETRLSGFNQEEFVTAFESAGGVWITVDQVGYHSYDGSHLRYDAALEFSRDLAQHILAYEKQRNREKLLIKKQAPDTSKESAGIIRTGHGWTK